MRVAHERVVGADRLALIKYDDAHPYSGDVEPECPDPDTILLHEDAYDALEDAMISREKCVKE